MPLHYDLHAHSTASDGTLTPTALVERAVANGIDVLALTDHDTLAGLSEATQAAANQHLELLPGVEISVTWQNTTIHIVALQFDPTNPALQAGLEQLLLFRHWRAEEIGRRLAHAGVSGAYAGAYALSNGHLISRTHFARHLVAEGRARNMRDCFRRYLTKGKPGHVPGQWASLDTALGWIQAAGGHAVIAHPARYDMTRSKLRKLVADFAELGGAALEVVSGSHSHDDVFAMAKIAMDFDLYASCGSDFHDPANTWTDLGRLAALPPGCKPVWDLFH